MVTNSNHKRKTSLRPFSAGKKRKTHKEDANIVVAVSMAVDKEVDDDIAVVGMVDKIVPAGLKKADNVVAVLMAAEKKSKYDASVDDIFNEIISAGENRASKAKSLKAPPAKLSKAPPAKAQEEPLKVKIEPGVCGVYFKECDHRLDILHTRKVIIKAYKYTNRCYNKPADFVDNHKRRMLFRRIYKNILVKKGKIADPKHFPKGSYPQCFKVTTRYLYPRLADLKEKPKKAVHDLGAEEKEGR